MKTINYKGKGEHSVNELELIIEQQAEELHLLKSGQKQLPIHDVVGRSEQFYCVGHKNNPCKDVNNQCKHCKVIEGFWKQ